MEQTAMTMGCVYPFVMGVPSQRVAPLLGDSSGSPYVPADNDRLVCRVGNIIDEILCPVKHSNVDTDDSYRQIIPYILVEDVTTGSLLVTKRLFDDACSLGLCGHLEAGEDIVTGKRRILEQMAGITEEMVLDEAFCGFICGNRTGFDKAHLGLVFLVGVVGKASIQLHESLYGNWLSLEDIAKRYKAGRFEPWSELAYEKAVLGYLAESREAYLKLEALLSLMENENQPDCSRPCMLCGAVLP